MIGALGFGFWGKGLRNNYGVYEAEGTLKGLKVSISNGQDSELL